ncbi:hypothetical protein [Nocardioides sp.]|uniref:hypothetical protein n=1 Tax=Nocardioides sp. TaxID=35761 RepID=UPI002B26A248|nr:hypothetical protein [Nocardioides sp.]
MTTTAPRSSRRPSAGLLVASLALVLAASGSSTALPGKNTVKADDLAKNSVTSKAIKAGAVKSADLAQGSVDAGALKKDSVRPSHLADNSVRGDDVQDGSLGSSDLVDYAVSSKNGVAIQATSGPGQDAARDNAAERVLLSAGPITVYGKCYVDTVAERLHAELFVKTTEADVLVNAPDGTTYSGGDVFLQPATPEAARSVLGDQVAPVGGSGARQSTITIASDQEYLTVLTSLFLQRRDPAEPTGPYGAGDRCLFGASIIG